MDSLDNRVMARQFLTLYDRFTQVWVNKYTLVIVILALKIYLFTSWVLSQAESARSLAELMCSSLDTYYATISSLPDEFGLLMSRMVTTMLNSTIGLAQKMLLMMLTIIKNLIGFYIDVFLGTYTCLLSAALSGTVDFALDSSEVLIRAVNLTIVTVSKDIQSGLDGLLDVINTLVSSAKKVESFFTTSSDDSSQYEEKIKLSIKALNNVLIPGSVLDSIDNLKTKTPDFSKLTNTTLILDKLFSFLREELNLSGVFKEYHIGNISQSLNSTKARSLNSSANTDICSGSLNIDSIFDSMEKDIQKASNIIIITMLCSVILVTLLLMFKEYIKWRKVYERYEDLQREVLRDFDFIAVNNIINKYESSLLYFADNHLFQGKLANKDKLRWFCSYVSTSYFLNAFLVGIAGLFAVLLQYLIFRIFLNGLLSFQKKANDIGSFVTDDLTRSTQNYVRSTNNYISNQQDTVNEELFGKIKLTSNDVNDTISDLLVNMNETVGIIFDDTPFAKPVSTLIYCTIGRKLENVEKGLTWIVNNLSLTLPKLPSNITSDLFSTQRSGSAILRMSTKLDSSITRLLDALYKTILTELYISLGILGACLVLLIIGLVKLSFESRTYNDDKQMKIGDPKALTTEQKKEYGYPHIDPFEKYDTSSSVYPSS